MDAWMQSLDRLLSGLAHEANGRATALRGIALLSEDQPRSLWAPLLEQESDRLERTAAGLSALRVEPPEPLDVRDAVRAAAPILAALHIELQLSADAAEATAVHGSRGLLVRTLVGLAVQLVPPHSATELRCELTGSAGIVRLALTAAEATSPAPLPVDLPGARLSVLPSGYLLELPGLGS